MERVAFDGLQSAYERVMNANGGLANLLPVVREFFKSLFVRSSAQSTVLVNASMVGGLVDELKRDATVIYI